MRRPRNGGASDKCSWVVTEVCKQRRPWSRCGPLHHAAPRRITPHSPGHAQSISTCSDIQLHTCINLWMKMIMYHPTDRDNRFDSYLQIEDRWITITTGVTTNYYHAHTGAMLSERRERKSEPRRGCLATMYRMSSSRAAEEQRIASFGSGCRVVAAAASGDWWPIDSRDSTLNPSRRLRCTPTVNISSADFRSWRRPWRTSWRSCLRNTFIILFVYTIKRYLHCYCFVGSSSYHFIALRLGSLYWLPVSRSRNTDIYSCLNESTSSRRAASLSNFW